MIDLLILILLLAGLFVGAKRGLIVQLIHMTGFVIALIVAYMYYKELAAKFVLWIPYPAVDSDSRLTLAIDQLDLDQTFYQLIAFALLFFVVKFALQLIASMFDFLKYLPVLGAISKLAGAILGFIEFYIIIFLLLYVLALLPLEVIQSRMDASLLSKFMLEHTPFLSEKVKEWWYIYVK
ncbi:CvpA family protein [Paenisporosarcina cavernae]|uniref:CvpA family protein n=1 Tax=Paenisporosarcina cavernae TaxID=2320858 RepID=A0A385YWB5_9BACL|nr:CvpA family protein [Paenisporosarcina cavernae]AYC29802.1 CvpA family protein [Paenisporosarcina cavernae]